MKKELLYVGKAKDVFATDKKDEVIVEFKNDATAGNGAKHDLIEGKGALNNEITRIIFEYLMSKGVKTHFIKKLNDREQLVRKVAIVPLEVIVRNYSAGHFASNYGVEEGIKLTKPTFEITYKKDELGDPLLNKDHAIALDIISGENYEILKVRTLEINEYLIELFDKMNIILVDFKLEFGYDYNGEIILADEFSPDNSRLWDKDTKEKLDKDNFRRGIGSLTDAYKIVLKRLNDVI